MLKKIFSLFLIAILAACASSERRADNPDRSKLGVLVIAGEGLNSTYENPKLTSLLFTVSQKFAEAVGSEIEKRGTPAALYINLDRNAKTTDYVSKLIANQKRDALVQVSVTHVRNATENSVYLEAKYYTLRLQHDEKGENFIPVEGPTVKYKLLGDGSDKDGRHTSFETFAKSFADKLYQEGYIGAK